MSPIPLDPSRPVDVLARFHHAARARPDAVALSEVSADGRGAPREVSYGRLARVVAHLGGRLRARGVGPESVVGIAAGHGVAHVAAVLGVLAADACFLPLDPALPPARLARIAREAGLRALLLPAESRGALAATGVEMLAVEDSYGGSAARAPAGSTPPEQPAYVIYTSGSTGAPKGVVVTRGGLANHAAGFEAGVRLRADDVVLQFANLAFDAAYEEILPALAAGARLVLRDAEMGRDVIALLRHCQERQVTLLDLPTAFWALLGRLLRADGLRLPDALRLIVLGGEEAPAAEVQHWRERFRDRLEVVNTYGPTEATIIATLGELLRAEPGEPGAVTLGDALPGTSVTLWRSGRRCAPGEPGEILIGGLGVARGYLGDARLTAERFVPDATGAPGARAYRTGDLGLLSATGELLFKGRGDHQVKLRGHRIQLEEVEQALLSHPAIGACAVVVRDDRLGGKQLVAHCVLAQGDHALPFTAAPLSVAELRRFLRERLPEYMLPAEFSFLEKFILTSSGKIDRAKLPELGHFDRQRRRLPDWERPQPGLETRLAAIWCDVLDLDPSELGVSDPFEYIGGNSLYGIQIRHRARQAGLHFDAGEMHLRQTVRGLARVCREERGRLGRARQALSDYAQLAAALGEVTALDLRRALGFERRRGAARARRVLARFYESLPDKDDVIYVYFTTKLLHWLWTTLRFVPPETNVVLVGAGLAPEESAWVRERIARPFLHFDQELELDTIWDLLFDVNQRNFGWLDPDCLVMNPALFEEMRRVGPRDAINCLWTHAACGPTKRPFHVLESYFLFFNLDVVRALRRSGHMPRPSARRASLRQARLLKRLIPGEDERGETYDSLAGLALSHRLFRFEYARLILFQLLANASGYRLNRVRFFTEIDTFNPYNYYSDEAIHVFPTIRWFDRNPWSGIDQKRRLSADWLLMVSLLDELPPMYHARRAFLEEKLRELELDPQGVKGLIREYLAARGVTRRTFDRPEFAWLADDQGQRAAPASGARQGLAPVS